MVTNPPGTHGAASAPPLFDFPLGGGRVAHVPGATRDDAARRLSSYFKETGDDERFEFERRHVEVVGDGRGGDAQGGGPAGACFRVEYDKDFWGGDYSGVGSFAYVPLALVGDGVTPERAFELYTGVATEHMIHYTLDELYTAGGGRLDDEGDSSAAG